MAEGVGHASSPGWPMLTAVSLGMTAAAGTLAHKPSPQQETPPQKQTRVAAAFHVSRALGRKLKIVKSLKMASNGGRGQAGAGGQCTHSCSCVQYTCVYRGPGLGLCGWFPSTPKPRESVSRIFPFALASCSHPHQWAPAHLSEGPRASSTSVECLDPQDTIKSRTSHTLGLVLPVLVPPLFGSVQLLCCPGCSSPLVQWRSWARSPDSTPGVGFHRSRAHG